MPCLLCIELRIDKKYKKNNEKLHYILKLAMIISINEGTFLIIILTI